MLQLPLMYMADNQSFFYHRFQELTEGMAATEKYHNSRTYLHRLGTELEQDEVILQHVKDMFAANDALYAIATQNGIGKLIRINYHGKIEDLKLPSDGAVNFLKNDPRLDGVFIIIRTWTKCKSY